MLTALFAALTCVATMVLVIPAPTGGYVNPGDAVVVLVSEETGSISVAQGGAFSLNLDARKLEEILSR